jgi:cytoskeletal protein CcmA (bactofilin family)
MWPFRAAKSDEVPTFEVDNTIGAGTTVRGDLTGPGGFRIDGAVEGSIEAQGSVVIGESGSIEGAVRARDVVVLGRVRGDVHATGHLEIGPNGKVVGDVTVPSFRMHKGGVFRGTSRMPGGADDAVELALSAASPTTTQPLGLPPPVPTASRAERRRGRTLPPPGGAVPPPADVAAPAVSEERLVTTPEDATASTGTDDA